MSEEDGGDALCFFRERDERRPPAARTVDAVAFQAKLLEEKVLQPLFLRPGSGPFHRPVNKKALPLYYETIKKPVDLATIRAAKGCESLNFEGSYLGQIPLVSAHFWTSDHLSSSSRTVNAFSDRIDR